MKRPAFFLLLLASTFPSANAADLKGKVVGVHDGDTLMLLDGTASTKIRLEQIDAPELSQPYGQKSKQSLSDICFGKQAVVDSGGTDKYGRTLGLVTCAGVDANAEQVRRGFAWFYVQYGRDDALRNAEAMARAAGAGLWADANPVPPWDWRHGGATKAKPKTVPGEAGSKGECGGKRYCKDMATCAEARHYLKDCGVDSLDRDQDGIPCESICR